MRCKFPRLASLPLLLLAFPAALVAQVTISDTVLSYSQAFNSLPVPATNGEVLAWTNNSTLAGWYRDLMISTGAVDNTRNFSGDGSAQTTSAPALFNYGNAGFADRALGMRVTTNQSGAIGVVLFNNGTLPIDTMDINFKGEQWRKSGQTITTQLSFGYRVASTFDNATYSIGPDTGFTGVPALTFVSPITTATGGPLDGNLAANSVTLSASVTLATPLQPGQYLILRWFYDPPSASGHGLAIDNLTVAFTQIPEPAGFALMTGLLALAAIGLRRRRTGAASPR